MIKNMILSSLSFVYLSIELFGSDANFTHENEQVTNLQSLSQKLLQNDNEIIENFDIFDEDYITRTLAQFFTRNKLKSIDTSILNTPQNLEILSKISEQKE